MNQRIVNQIHVTNYYKNTLNQSTVVQIATFCFGLIDFEVAVAFALSFVLCMSRQVFDEIQAGNSCVGVSLLVLAFFGGSG